jgi:hypothetical protein
LVNGFTLFSSGHGVGEDDGHHGDDNGEDLE